MEYSGSNPFAQLAAFFLNAGGWIVLIVIALVMLVRFGQKMEKREAGAKQKAQDEASRQSAHHE